jgi:hypothetical protein
MIDLIRVAKPDIYDAPIQTLSSGVFRKNSIGARKVKPMNELIGRILGVLKFVTPDKLGVGRFVKIGIPAGAIAGSNAA